MRESERIVAIDLDGAGAATLLDLKPLASRGRFVRLAYSRAQGMIAFCRWQEDRAEIFAACADGSGEHLVYSVDLSKCRLMRLDLNFASEGFVLVTLKPGGWFLGGEPEPDTMVINAATRWAFALRAHTVAAVARDEVVLCRWGYSMAGSFGGHWIPVKNIRVSMRELAYPIPW